MQKNSWIGLLLLAVGLILGSCKNDNIASGDTLLKPGDDIIVVADSFPVTTRLARCAAIISSPDSMLLGEVATPLGTTKTEVLTQFACPVGYQYPETAVLDSVCLLLYYQSWTGDSLSPLEIDVREMDLQTMTYSQLYESDIDPNDYCTLTSDDNRILDQARTVVPAREATMGSGSSYHYIRIKTSKDWAQKFFQNYRDFRSQEDFSQQFHGLYLTTTFGGGCALNINSISLDLYYRFTYEKTVIVGDQYVKKDTTVSDVKSFYANSEVRQVNRVEYYTESGEEADLYEMLSKQDSLSFIIAPAGIHTQISIPLRNIAKEIFDSIRITDTEDLYKRPYVNMARIRLDVIDKEELSSTKYTAKPAKELMLIKSDSVDMFFKDRRLPYETLAIVSSINTYYDKTGKEFSFYLYDISTLLTFYLRETYDIVTDHIDLNRIPEYLDMTLVPVETEYSSSTSYGSMIIGVHQAQSFSQTVIASSRNKKQPLNIEVVYSGF